MLIAWCRRFNAALRACSNASARAMVVAGNVGALIFTAYGIVWLYVTPVEHESLGLRSLAVLLCLSVGLSPFWPKKLKPFLPWVWFAAVMYALPFYATYQLLGSNYSMLRSMLLVSMAFFVVVIFPHYALALLNMTVGISLGVLAGYLTIPEFATLNHGIVRSVHLQVMIYSVTAGLLFTRSNLDSILAKERVDTLKDLAGSIAHELRNPLGQLRQRLDNISGQLPPPVVDGQSVDMPVRALDTVYEELAQGRIAIDRGMQLISMTLDEIHAKPLNVSNLRYLSAEAATRKAVEEFGYESMADRDRVELRVKQDFLFKGDETRYLFVVFNLLKNAVYYFKEKADARIIITVGQHSVTVEDTGPGMRPEVLSHVFESFNTSGKAGGTGLGLSFCKRTMVAFGGDINCESELNHFTRFILSFPRVLPEAIAEHKAQVLDEARRTFAGKRVLVVDDSPILRMTAGAMLEPLGVAVEEAEHGHDALQKLSQRHFDAMVLDLSMPVLDGYATAEKIRTGHIPGMARLPIVVHTAESATVARAKLERVAVEALVSKPCSQVELVEALSKAHEQARQRKETDLAAASLAGKSVLLVDDEEFNRRYLRALLEASRIHVVEAEDGAVALRLLDSHTVDAIITDIHMPVLDGIGLALAVRDSSLARKPVIIALSGRDDDTAITRARAAGIADFISKPAEPSMLFDKLALHLSSKDFVLPLSPSVSLAMNDSDSELLNLGHLDTLRSVGVINKVVPQAVEATRELLDQLQQPIAQRDTTAAKELLHSLIGLSGNMGSHTLHQKARGMYVRLVEHQQWPKQDWYPELVQLHAQTEQALRSKYLQAA